jgi:hypothetical protein
LGFGYHGDESIEYGKAHSFDEKIQGLSSKIKENVQFLRDRNIIPVWAFMRAPSEDFSRYLNSLSEELSVRLIDPVPIYKKHFPALRNMATEHSGHFKPEVYALLGEQIFNEVFQRESTEE